ncbi:DNA-binding response OmpR family regulator [Roseimicrobium gellanilyticum]|uniref:DNA-binding response OmpR family regulator n=1 Tax=Roseimicrobium gellanilyticum TaxID=748857 RepID=A0A366H2E3_9BACT|nr:response regulator transcription factor [Roseimicrobium gellanilyticum]RBP35214.1 DNA-binding response OmpR family regulator [Roseimicrobium gellanilyticum]
MKLLLADDDPITLDSLAACLEPEGFTSVLARDGAEAFALWQQQRPALVCLDIMMPRMDGYEVCRRIREQDASVPVLFLSAKSEEVDVVVGLRLGADDFIRKPFGKQELLARIHAALRRSQKNGGSGRPRAFTMQDIMVYPHELRATRGETEMDLTPREVSILQLLHERAGEAVTRDELLDRCWGLQYLPESRTLDQHIAKLRRKVELDVENPHIIETVRGMGYRHRVSAAVG